MAGLSIGSGFSIGSGLSASTALSRGNGLYFGGFGGAFSPAVLFAQGEQGVWYDPSDILLGWRYNLLTYTEQFDNAAWLKANATLSANAAIAPNGTTTADLMYPASSGTYRGCYQNVAGNVCSIYAKASGKSKIAFVDIAGAAGAAWYDLSAGTVGTVKSGYTATITSVGDGWYRCTVSHASSFIQFFTFVVDADNSATVTANGTDGVYLWGAQLQTGSVATTYQPITKGVNDYFTYQPLPILYQDSAGTTPVVAVEQPVGLMLDKSKGLTLGSELVTNGTFDTNTTGWTLWQTATISVDSSRLKVENGASTISGAYQLITVVVGQTYKFEGAKEAGTAAAPRYYLGTSIGGQQYSSNATSGQVFVATSTTLAVTAATQSTVLGAYAFFDNISVKSLAGNHAFQATSASRPVLSARYNLLTKTEQFDDAVWVKTSTTVTADTTVAPDGTTTADTLTQNSASGVLYQAASCTATSYTASIYVKQGTDDYAEFIFNTAAFALGVNVRYRFSTNTYTTTLGGSPTNVVVTVADAANSFKRISIKVDATAATWYFDVHPVTNGSTLIIWGAGLRVSNDGVGLPVYQRVNTSTDYDTVGFPPYLRFDGVDDSMATANISFTGTDKMTVFAGVRKLSDATLGAVAELSSDTNSNNGSFMLLAAPSGPTGYYWRSKGTVAADVAAGTYAAPITNVFTGVGNISAPASTARVNGLGLTPTTTSQGTGNFGNYPLFIGSRNSASLRLNGRIFSLIVRGAATDAATITQTETWVNGETKAYA